MAYENLKAAIKQAIKQNGNQEITGNLLQSTLLSMADSIPEVVQESGDSENLVTSQKLVTDTFNDLSLKNAILNSQKVSVSLGKNLFNKNNSDNIIGYYFGNLGGLIKNDSFIITHPH